MNVSMESSSSSIDVSSETIANISYSVGFSVAILLVLVIVSYASYKCYRSSAVTNLNFSEFHGRSMHDTNSAFGDGTFAAPKGLDEDILVKYPKLLYSEAKPQKGNSIASGCSICLADYKDDDVVRLLPSCGHFFHLKCIDPWLKLHPSCPICRSKPLPTPLAEAMQQN